MGAVGTCPQVRASGVVSQFVLLRGRDTRVLWGACCVSEVIRGTFASSLDIWLNLEGFCSAVRAPPVPR